MLNLITLIKIQNHVTHCKLFCSGINEAWAPSGLDQEEFASEPDPSLEDGQELPQYYGVFPEEFYHCLLEDIDDYYKQQGLEVSCNNL